MLERTVDHLARDLADRRRLGEPPPVLLLGAGASVESGVGAMAGIYELAGVADFASFVPWIETRSDSERYRLLAEYLQTRDPARVTPGYQSLAALCADAFLDIVLTTNLDPLLDDGLAAARLWRRDYVLLVNGLVRIDRLSPLLRGRHPRVKIVKLHGDLFQRRMAWTPSEMDSYLDEIAPVLKPAINGRDVVVVGHSLRDRRIRELILGAGGEAVWYVSPSAVPAGLESDPRVRAVVGQASSFEALFTRLGATLGSAIEAAETLRETPVAAFVRQPSTAAQPVTGAETVDDVMASVVGILGPNGVPFMTGFVLANPRIIIADGWVGNTAMLTDGPVSIVSADGGRHSTGVLKSVRDHPFGPLLLDCPAALKVPGLRLSSAEAAPGSKVRIAIAAGERVGLASGSVANGLEARVDIAPIGPVDHLVQVDAAVAPGSSGAPVVDEDMNVLGFIVAGSTDPDRPVSYVYPAARWARHVTAVPSDAAS